MCNQNLTFTSSFFAVDVLIYGALYYLIFSLKTNTLLMVIKGKKQDCGSILKYLNCQRNTAIDHAPCVII